MGCSHPNFVDFATQSSLTSNSESCGTLHAGICRWLVRRRRNFVDFHLLTELCEDFSFELNALVSENALWEAESTEQMIHEDFYDDRCRARPHWERFRPLCKVVHHGQNVLVSTLRLWMSSADVY